jgi:hypothetical protein
MDEADVRVAAFADLAAISVLQRRASTEHQVVNEQLQPCADGRVVIEQARRRGVRARASRCPARSTGSGYADAQPPPHHWREQPSTARSIRGVERDRQDRLSDQRRAGAGGVGAPGTITR